MNTNNLLPLGSVVRLHEQKSPIMIIGYGPGNAEDKVRAHYLGVNYPFGLNPALCSLAFNHEEICEVTFEGYKEPVAGEE